LIKSSSYSDVKFETKLLLDLIILLCSEPAAAVVIDSDPIGEHMENEPAEINVVITFYCFSLSIHHFATGQGARVSLAISKTLVVAFHRWL
jgi:hypothetical protein